MTVTIEPQPSPSPAPFQKLHVDGTVIKDSSGNPIRLQGFNVEPRDMDEEGMQWMVSRGFNYLRVTVFWHRLETSQGYDSTYFGYLDNLLAWCEQYHIYANLCFMQWQWSPYFTYYLDSKGTGFPEWVISPGVYPDSATGLRDCIADFFMVRGSHGSFMRQKFFGFWDYLISRYKDNPYVFAYEVFNEPTIAKGVSHVEGVHEAVMNLYEEFTATYPDAIHIYHDIGGDGTAERDVSYQNIVWTRSWYDLMWNGYSSAEHTALVTKLSDLKTKYNLNLGCPFIVSEMGFTTTTEAMGGAVDWIRDSFDAMRSISLNNGYESYGWWIYSEGTKYGFRAPRNSDGTDTWVVPILQEYSHPEQPPPPLDPKNWYGVGIDFKTVTNQYVSIEYALDRWNTYEIPNLLNLKLNTVRLAFSFPGSGGDTHSSLVYSELDQVIGLLDANGIKVILDLHNWAEMDGYFGSPNWIQAWVELAVHYKNDNRVLAYELMNEPFKNTWHYFITGSGARYYDGTEGMANALAECVDAIRATGDTHLIVYPDPWYWRGPNGSTDMWHPENFHGSSLDRDNIVITFHDYAQSQDTMTEMYDWLAQRKARVQAWQKYYPVWLGETGMVRKDSPIEHQWCVEWINFALEIECGFNYWMHGYTSRTQAWQLVTQSIENSNYEGYYV